MCEGFTVFALQRLSISGGGGGRGGGTGARFCALFLASSCGWGMVGMMRIRQEVVD